VITVIVVYISTLKGERKKEKERSYHPIERRRRRRIIKTRSHILFLSLGLYSL
jgi:hypothetical protein